MKQAEPQTYDALAVFGTAYNFEEDRYPQQFYDWLDAAAAAYHEEPTLGGIAVCGSAAIKDLEAGRVPPTEAIEGKSYLMLRHGIPEDRVFTDEESTTTPDNVINLKMMAMQRDWRNIGVFTATDRAPRIAFLGQKICWGFCEIDVQGIGEPGDPRFHNEPLLLGDAVCTLKDMPWGDHEYLLNSDGTPRWNGLRKAHHDCPDYISGTQIGIKIAPFTNNHPEELMRAYGVPPEQ